MAKYGREDFIVTHRNGETLRVPLIAHLACHATVRPAALPPSVKGRVGLRVYGRGRNILPTAIAVRLVRTSAGVQTHAAPGLLSVDAHWATADICT